MQDLTPLAGTIGTIIGAAIALIGTNITQRYQLKLERLRNEHAMRNARQDRLRETYETVLLGAAAMDAAAGRILTLLRTKLPATRAEAVRELLAPTADLNRAGIRLQLEPAAADVVETFHRARDTWIAFQATIELVDAEWSSPDRPQLMDECIRQRRALETAVEELHTAMLQSLEQFDDAKTMLRHSRWMFWRR